MFRETVEYITPLDSTAAYARAERQSRPLQGLEQNAGSLPGNSTVGQDSARLSDGTWRFLERGLQQRFEGIAAFLQHFQTERRLPGFLQGESVHGLELHLQQWAVPVALKHPDFLTWALFGATDLALEADGTAVVMDQDFSHPAGLERLTHEHWKDTSDAVEFVRRELFANWLPRGAGNGEVVVLDPGFSGATFRGNDFLARCLSASMARSSDLKQDRDGIFLRVRGDWRPVRTLVRRVDDELLDPNCFRPDSLVGVPGLVQSWAAGRVHVLNPPGSGMLRLRRLLRLIPQMIREYLAQEPLLETAEVLPCGDPDVLKKVLSAPQHFAIRPDDPRHAARPWFGGSGDLQETEQVLSRIQRAPDTWIARPLLMPSAGRRNLRVFSTKNGQFRLLRAGLVRPCQEDGGASLLIGPDEAITTLW